MRPLREQQASGADGPIVGVASGGVRGQGELPTDASALSLRDAITGRATCYEAVPQQVFVARALADGIRFAEMVARRQLSGRRQAAARTLDVSGCRISMVSLSSLLPEVHLDAGVLHSIAALSRECLLSVLGGRAVACCEQAMPFAVHVPIRTPPVSSSLLIRLQIGFRSLSEFAAA